MVPFIKDSPHAGAYVRVWKRARAAYRDNPETMFDRSYANPWPTTAKRVYQEFLEALDNRINLRGGLASRGRKDCQEYITDCYRDQRAIHDKVTQRVRVYQFSTAECRRRFAHLLDHYDD